MDIRQPLNFLTQIYSLNNSSNNHLHLNSINYPSHWILLPQSSIRGQIFILLIWFQSLPLINLLEHSFHRGEIRIKKRILSQQYWIRRQVSNNKITIHFNNSKYHLRFSNSSFKKSCFRKRTQRNFDDSKGTNKAMKNWLSIFATVIIE